ncbi:unnamed protein product [Kluyveromyces dobzhanskii CBS 2104]|uniref:Dynactin subunit 5 n=1 Tax=Kluyveromyces dobzhanskii CBS 2104 TaxID=1427455 RepID=A0A0A8L6K4_9SACH|nr:unnamed protein product [Kluyveromyces dobzhanskii CBS 2104]
MDWVETGQGTRISKNASVLGPDKIVLAGHSVISGGCTLEGNVLLVDDENDDKQAQKKSSDKYTISMGRFCVLEPGVRVRPPVVGYRKRTDAAVGTKLAIHSDLLVNSYIWIGQNCKVYCKRMGSRVVVGAGTQLNRCCEIGDVVIIDDGLVVPERYKIPSYSRVSRHPRIATSIVVKSLPPTFGPAIEDWCRKRYLGVQLPQIHLPQMVTPVEEHP